MDLPFHQGGIHSLADIMDGQQFLDLHQSGFLVHFHLGKGHRISSWIGMRFIMDIDTQRIEHFFLPEGSNLSIGIGLIRSFDFDSPVIRIKKIGLDFLHFVQCLENLFSQLVPGL